MTFVNAGNYPAAAGLPWQLVLGSLTPTQHGVFLELGRQAFVHWHNLTAYGFPVITQFPTTPAAQAALTGC